MQTEVHFSHKYLQNWKGLIAACKKSVPVVMNYKSHEDTQFLYETCFDVA